MEPEFGADDQFALDTLANGVLHRFADWPNPDVPNAAHGVYSVWLPDERLLYVGMAGRAMDTDPANLKRRGLWTRLNQHASGRRSGDQFYVCDRLIVPSLSPDERRAIGEGALSLDARTKAFIHESLSYRFVVATDDQAAYRIERLVQSGGLPAGRPILNPRP